MIYLSAQVPAKNIQLTLSTGYTVQRNLKLSSFPPCITYTFQVRARLQLIDARCLHRELRMWAHSLSTTLQMDYYPIESSEYRNFCSDYVPLPFAINTTQALGLKEIHLSDRFIMPHKEGYVYRLGCCCL